MIFIKVDTFLYSRFRGVDMTSDPSNIDRCRSPYAPNLISDSDGYPEKRVGYRKIASFMDRVNSVFFVKFDFKEEYVIHTGSLIYTMSPKNEFKCIKTQVNNDKSVGFVFRNKLYLFTGKDYLCYDGYQILNVRDIAKIPLHVIGRRPDGGGKVYESLNLLQSKRIDAFQGDGQSKLYYLSAKSIDNVVEVKINGSVLGKAEYTFDKVNGTVSFKIAPPKPTVDGADNVEIVFDKAVQGYRERIEACSIAVFYGYGNNDRLIVSGNGKYKNYDWISESYDPTYFPDVGYSIVGTENTAIMGYAKLGNTLAIIKESNSQDSTIFFRNAVMYENRVIFTVKQSIVGVGLIAKNCVGTIDDEPVFLSENGVYAITKNNLTAGDTVQNRSWFINRALTKEKDLKNAVVVTYKNRFMISINGNVYILDGNSERVHKEKTNGDFIYECYFWNNIEASCFCTHDDKLLFGSNDGNLYIFNTDLDYEEKYSDDGEAIVAEFTTRLDDDGDFGRYKSLFEKGLSIKLKPYTHSGVEVYIETDRLGKKKVFEQNVDILRFPNWNFARISFKSAILPQIIPIRVRCKKYITMQITVSNSKNNECFGVLGIMKRSIKGNYVK